MLQYISKNIWKIQHHFRQALLFIIINEFLQTLVEAGGDLGSIECVNGKWQVDTKIISLIVVCPIQISWDSLMCVFKRLGLYDNGVVHEDFHVFLCSLFATRDLIFHCIKEFGNCLDIFGGVGFLELNMIPVGICVWESVHSKVNCTV